MRQMVSYNYSRGSLVPTCTYFAFVVAWSVAMRLASMRQDRVGHGKCVSTCLQRRYTVYNSFCVYIVASLLTLLLNIASVYVKIIVMMIKRVLKNAFYVKSMFAQIIKGNQAFLV